MDDKRTVTVVVPAVSRASVREAVLSALGQDLPPLEVLVVLDRADGVPPVALPDDPRVRVLSTGGGKGPAAARMLGVDRAQGALVAFLDDDDTWAPDKLSRQVAEHARLAGGGAEPVVSCRARVLTPGDDVGVVAPADLYAAPEDVGDHLFVRHRVQPTGFALASSTLLCSTALLRRVPWDRSLRLHEDWDWVLRVSRTPGVVLSVLPEPLVDYAQHPLAAPTASRPAGGWDRSAAWAESAGLSPRALGDFLLSVTAGQALQQGCRRAALGLAVRAVRQGRPGPAAWAAFALQLCVPPAALRGLAVALRRARQGRGAPASSTLR